MTAVTTTFAAARARYRGSVSLVPTMGFFHEGHLALLRAARSAADTVVVSHFVNPLQFNDPADLDRYPRDFDRDLALAREEGVDVVFAPGVEEVYPEGSVTRVGVPGLADSMEGLRRPGHFEGVATVVAKLFAGLQPERAHFGRKDAQQLALIRRMATDLRFPIEIVSHPTVRESDGLALSSRNVFLSPEDRVTALGISTGLFAAADLAERGERDALVLASAVRSASPGIDFEYVTLATQDGAAALDRLDRPAFLAVAAVVGAVRLIDNVMLDASGSVDRGRRLDSASVIYERR